MAESKKDKTVNLGFSKEMMDFLKDVIDRQEEKEYEDKDLSKEIKKMTINIVKREVEKIDEKLKNDKIKHDEWLDLIEDLDKLTDVVRWM